MPRESQPEISRAKLAEARELLENRFGFYGEKHQLPDDIDRDGNPGTKHWGHDPNRFTYLHPLIGAYQATDDSRYSRKTVDLILDWITRSNVGRCFRGSPYVWGSYLNNAIRCSRWSRCLKILIDHEQITPIELLRVLKSLHELTPHYHRVVAASKWRSTTRIQVLPVILGGKTLVEVNPVFEAALRDQITDEAESTLTDHLASKAREVARASIPRDSRAE